MINDLPDEVLLNVFKFLVSEVEQLARTSQVSKRFYRLIQFENPHLWYLSFKTKYPIWSNKIQYTLDSVHLIDWKEFVIRLNKQQNSTNHVTFEFVQEQLTKKRKRTEDTTHRFWIQDPLVVDIDRTTQTGVVATGKHRKNLTPDHTSSEHKILFWSYPSWRLIRIFEFNLKPHHLSCQIISLQSIQLGSTLVRFFSLAVGIPAIQDEDRVDIWKALFIYRLMPDGTTQSLCHIRLTDMFLGREIFLFSDTSWTGVRDWMRLILPDEADYPAQTTVFVLAMGPVYHQIRGCVQLARFDLNASQVLDPSLTEVVWDFGHQQLISRWPSPAPTSIMTCIRLGTDVSCMIHFKYPASLNHLICTGSSQEDELSVYDWRFGVKVGSLPWQARLEDVRPWGLESTFVLPQGYGLRLIAVGDNRGENTRARLEIKVWDISYLLEVEWDPMRSEGSLEETEDELYPWWSRRTSTLDRLVTQSAVLPYSPRGPSVLLSHVFDKEDHRMPVKYTAYNVLHTLLFLLTEDGTITVMDIETGQVMGTVENVAGNLEYDRIRGIDINVIGGHEVVVTSREGLLRGLVS